MAAVFALVFLFALASAGLLFRVFMGGDASLGSVLGYLTFFAMTTGVFLGLYKMMKGWEGPEHDAKH